MTQGYQVFLEKKAFLDLLGLAHKAYLVRRASKVYPAVQGLLEFQVSWSLCAVEQVLQSQTLRVLQESYLEQKGQRT